MKTILLTFLLVLPTTVLLSQDIQYKIEGEIKDAPEHATAFLSYRLMGKEHLDSSKLQKGIYSFNGSVDRPILASIYLDYNNASRQRSKDKIDLYLENGTIKLTANDSISSSKIEGHSINDDFRRYKEMIAVPDKSLENINERWANASMAQKTDSAFRAGFANEAAPFSEEKIELQKKFIAANPNSYISLITLREVAGSIIDYTAIYPLFMSLSAEVRNTNAAHEFAERLEKANLISIGKIAPQFSQNDSSGHLVKLSDFAGKYVLVDFWASWCGPCRAENPNLVKTYQQFKGKNFTILSVSLDSDGKNWKRAIIKDNLTWTHVSDLKYWKNAVAVLYDIRSIPANYLLDPSGRIIAKNLRGEELAEKLSEIFAK